MIQSRFGDGAQSEAHAPMTLGNIYELGVHHLIASCLNNACRRQALIDVSGYPVDTEVPWFGRRAICGKCGTKRVDVGANWKERPELERTLAAIRFRDHPLYE